MGRAGLVSPPPPPCLAAMFLGGHEQLGPVRLLCLKQQRPGTYGSPSRLYTWIS
jgi:hypothetical protein